MAVNRRLYVLRKPCSQAKFASNRETVVPLHITDGVKSTHLEGGIGEANKRSSWTKEVQNWVLECWVRVSVDVEYVLGREYIHHFLWYGSAAVRGLLEGCQLRAHWPDRATPFTHPLEAEGLKTETGTRDTETGVMFVFMAKCFEQPWVSMLFSISCSCSRVLSYPFTVVCKTGQLKLNLSTYCKWHLTAFWDPPPHSDLNEKN